jgi:malonate-semialdehyde dehydrogenase (acetylating)/methylmalonate-semialdehyde dehydrogenase
MSALAESLQAPSVPVPHWINGTAIPGSGPHAPVYNPSLGQVIRQVPLAGAAEVAAAVQSAADAFPAWARLPALRRARILFQLKGLLDARAKDLARVISEEHGKTLDDAHGEVVRGLEVVEFACGAPQLLKGEFSESVGSGVDSYSVRQPLGVVAGITPFNFPAMVPLWMFPVALACGNTFVLKPSERDPSASVLLASWLQEAGLPPGVFNVVHGGKEAVDALLDDPRVQALSFVGSTPVAKYLHTRAAAAGKRVQALGGAKNHMVVMPDADLDTAVEGLVGAAYGSAGERCMAISVAVVVGDTLADALIEKLCARLTRLRVGPPDGKDVEMGPLVTREHLERVLGYIDAGVRDGATLVADGRTLDIPGNGRGFFVGPTLFDHVRPGMTIYAEEIFGPVLCVVRVPDYRAAVDLINSHPYANGTAIFTQSGAVARDFATDIQVGMVGVNVPIPVPMAFHSFGGWRSSLFGDHHVYGTEGVRFYTRMKTVTQRWPGRAAGRAEFVMPTMK